MHLVQTSVDLLQVRDRILSDCQILMQDLNDDNKR